MRLTKRPARLGGSASLLERHQPLALYMEGALGELFGKMGYGVLRYSPNPVVAVVDSRKAGQDLLAITGIDRPCPIVATLEEAKSLGAEVLILGIAPPGGQIPAEWYPVLEHAIALGFSLVNGLHERLSLRFPSLPSKQFVWDVRVEPANLGVGTGAAAGLEAKRLLMIGTDMAIGKMTAGLEIVRSAQAAGLKTEFVATGQIGIVIWGSGVALDAVRIDFAAGAVEREVIKHAGADLIVVEGQGSLAHPASSATLPLIRGSCPTHLVLCHKAGQQTLARVPSIRIPELGPFVNLYQDLAEACGTFPRPVLAGVALNTSALDDQAAEAACNEIEGELGVPCVDPVRHGAAALISQQLDS